MKKISSMAKKETGIAVHIALGVLLSAICTFIMSIILTVMVENETISPGATSSFAIGIHAISVFIGSMLSLTLGKGRIAVVAGIVAVCYLVVLLCINMLIFSSGFESIGAEMISSFAGGLLSMFLKIKFNGKKKHRMKVHSR